jgi:TonB family protein
MYHLLWIGPSLAGLGVNVRVTDLSTSEVILSGRLNLSEKPEAPLNVDRGDTHVSVRAATGFGSVMAWLQVEKGGKIVDAIHAMWLVEPQPVPVPKAMNEYTPAAITAADSMRSHFPDALRVGGDVQPPKVKRRVEPRYPDDARRNGVGGVVIMEAIIGADGHVKDVTLLKDQPWGLGRASLDAVKQWTFEPGTLNGEPIPVIFDLTINFKVSRSGPIWESVAPPPPP